jgi:hypothetical protein
VTGDPLPCDSVHVEAVLAPGDGPTPEVWDTAVVVTNLGPDACALDGPGELEFLAGGDQASMSVNYSTAAPGLSGGRLSRPRHDARRQPAGKRAVSDAGPTAPRREASTG